MDLDYAKLGFKAGIEIHQELNTKKLFCNCSSSLEEKKKISTTIRKLRSVAGESGDVDLASMYEQLRDRLFVYEGFKGEFCLVDLDEEPPHPVDNEALLIGLKVAKLFKLKVPDSICVMRKTVTDGSSVSGFQRTMIIGTEGNDSYLETKKGKVKIEQLNLEEDACKIIKKENNKIIYSLSRQGVPLLEIGTDASIKNPAHFKEVALLIGTMLRSFNVKRGLGTIRQDVNVSIKGGARIEVKGWQDLKTVEDLVKNEVLRQHNLLKIKKELTKRGLRKFEKISTDATYIFENTKSKIISDLIKSGGSVYALVLPKFSGLLKEEICIGKTFGKELSEYAKAYGTKGMIHSDEDLKKYKLENEFKELKQKLNTSSNDLILIIAENKNISEKAIESVYKRALYCLKGVPEETRIPNHNNATSSYARPLPGAHRMYPETDIPNIIISQKKIKDLELPELLPNKIKRISKKYNLSEYLSKEVISTDFEKYVKTYSKTSPEFIATILIEFPKEIRKRYHKQIIIDNYIKDILKKLEKKDISKDAVFEILVELSNGKSIDFSKYKPLSEKEIVLEIKNIIRENPELPKNALIGKVMEKLRGKAKSKFIVECINKIN